MESTIVDGAWKGHLGRGLARRQLQFLLLVLQGMTSKEIAKVSGVAPGTVDKSLQRAMFTVGAKRRAELVSKAASQMIITPLCLLLAGLMTFHTATDGEMARRDRRPSERQGAEHRSVRRADSFDLIV